MKLLSNQEKLLTLINRTAELVSNPKYEDGVCYAFYKMRQHLKFEESVENTADKLFAKYFAPRKKDLYHDKYDTPKYSSHEARYSYWFGDAYYSVGTVAFTGLNEKEYKNVLKQNKTARVLATLLLAEIIKEEENVTAPRRKVRKTRRS